MTVYRAANDDYVAQGYSFTGDIESARAYLDNPSFGGRTLYSATIEMSSFSVLDLVDANDPWSVLSEVANREITPDMGGYEVSQAIQMVRGLLDDIADAGYDLVRYTDDYPADCVTYTIVSSDAEDIEFSVAE